MHAGTKYSVVANTEMCSWFFKIEHGNGRTTLINSAVPMSRPCPSFPMDLIPADERRASVPIFYMDREVTLDSPDIHHYRARYPFGYEPPDDMPIPLTRLSSVERSAENRALELLAASAESEVKSQRDEALNLLRDWYYENLAPTPLYPGTNTLEFFRKIGEDL